MTSKTDLARYRAMQAYGCSCCRQLGYPGTPGDIHHLVDRGNRQASGGNRASIVLCPLHHRNVIPEGYTAKTALAAFGPSLAAGKKPFVAHWGSERELLAKLEYYLGGSPEIASPATSAAVLEKPTPSLE